MSTSINISNLQTLQPQRKNKPQNLETGTAIIIILLLIPIVMLYIRLCTAKCLNHKLFHVAPHPANIISLRLKHLKHLSHRSLVSNVFLIITFVKFEILAKLVYWVVCQVHKGVFHVFYCWLLVFLCGKSGKSVLVNEDAEWVTAGQQNVKTKIELQAFY